MSLKRHNSRGMWDTKNRSKKSTDENDGKKCRVDKEKERKNEREREKEGERDKDEEITRERERSIE